jgi:hypothetical protein
MSHSRCFRCGALTDSVLPATLCVTCHGREDETQRPPAAATNAPTAAFAPPTTDAVTQTNPADPFGVLPAGGYRYGRLLGQGGMGCVYQAVRVSTGQTVAIKKLRAERYFPGLIQRFVQEAHILSRLDHPNVVRLLDFVPAAGDPHIVMEFVDGQSLADRVVDGRPLAADTAARLIADAARGVQAIHDAGIIHRDLKPGNLLLTADGRVKVTDFGLGKLTEADDGLTVVGGPVGGTPGYSAPEQVAESGASDARTDVWGLGACLYAALTGRPPFMVGRANLTRVLSDPLLPPRAFNPHVPPVLDAIVCKCLERDPDLRYQSAAALADDLDRYRRGESTVARPLPWATRTWRRARQVPRATAAAWAMTAAAVAVAVTLAGFAPPRDGAGPPTDILREDRPFTLVPRGKPVTTEWLFGEVPIALRADGSEVAFFRTGNGPSAVLFRPQADSGYRLEADLRHIPPAIPIASCAGLIFAHQQSTTAGGTTDTFLSVDFCDADAVAAGGPPGPQRAMLRLHYYHTLPGGKPNGSHMCQVGKTVIRFTPAQAQPGPWRRITAEVTPAGVTVRWRGDADDLTANTELLTQVTAADINAEMRSKQEELRMVAKDLARPIDRDVQVKWNPRGGVGVWATRAELEFRNVTFTPLITK